MVFAGESYLLHSLFVTVQAFSLIALIHLIGVSGVFAVMLLGYFNQILPKNRKVAPPLPRDLPHVAVIIPTYGEPPDIVENTIVAATRSVIRRIVCMSLWTMAGEAIGNGSTESYVEGPTRCQGRESEFRSVTS
jgi:hypothetical protein